MRYRLLGPTGLQVSELCFGAGTFGESWGSDETESRRVLDAYIDAGGNFVDTANKYAGGIGEEYLGRFLRGRRDSLVVATKYTASTDDRDPNAAGNARKNLRRSIEASLRRLQTDHIDVLYVHSWDAVTTAEELMRALDDQVRAGTVLYPAVSNAPAWFVAQANTLASLRGWSPFVALQTEYSLAERTAERELLPMADALGLTVLAWSPLASGILTGKYLEPGGAGRVTADPATFARDIDGVARSVVDAAKQAGCTPAQAALAWIRHRAPAMIPVIGARTVEQLHENIGSLDVTLPDDQLDRLEQATAIQPGSPTAFLRSVGGRRFMWGDSLTPPSRDRTS